VERSSSVLEALSMLNGYETMMAADQVNSPMLVAAMDMPGLTDAERLRTLYLAALTREPTEAELSRLTGRLGTARDDAERRELFSDIMWALLNSSEFVLNQ
jgi:hypothetical protein